MDRSDSSTINQSPRQARHASQENSQNTKKWPRSPPTFRRSPTPAPSSSLESGTPRSELFETRRTASLDRQRQATAMEWDSKATTAKGGATATTERKTAQSRRVRKRRNGRDGLDFVVNNDRQDRSGVSRTTACGVDGKRLRASCSSAAGCLRRFGIVVLDFERMD